MVLCMVSKKPYNHTCLTYGFQETFMVVIPGIISTDTSDIFNTNTNDYDNSDTEVNNN